jgi:hypothetical protein
MLAPQPHQLANGAIQNVRTKRDLTAFLHACAFSQLPSTFLRAIQRGHFSSWPGLIMTLITKHLPKSLATSKGHLPTHGTEKHTVDQNYHRPTPSHVTQYHSFPGTKQPTNECCFCHHPNRSQTMQIILGPNRQVPRVIISWLQLRHDTI